VPDSPSLLEHFFRWLNRHAPQYLDDLRRSFGAPTTREVLAHYCRTRDEGAWLLDAYYGATGRHLPTDTLAVLRQWFAALRLSRLDRTAGWLPVHPDLLMALLPEHHAEDIERGHALRPVLGAAGRAASTLVVNVIASAPSASKGAFGRAASTLVSAPSTSNPPQAATTSPNPNGTAHARHAIP
jgi:hypothetical protein